MEMELYFSGDLTGHIELTLIELGQDFPFALSMKVQSKEDDEEQGDYRRCNNEKISLHAGHALKRFLSARIKC